MNDKSEKSYLLLSKSVIETKKNDLIELSYIADENVTLSEYFPVVRFNKKFNESCRVIGDGFQMLCQTSGTIKHIEEVGRCPDNNDSYRIYGPDEKPRYYNYLVIESSSEYTLYGFISCWRFSGFFEFHNNQVLAIIDGENITLSQGMHQLESIAVLKGKTLNNVYDAFSDLIAKNHPVRSHMQSPSPIGWCSWYAYYAGVSARDISDNLAEMTDDFNDIEYVLLDDGYQAFMGDWLTPSERFKEGMKIVIDEIKAQGKKPAIWLAPFIAEPQSALFREHPDWFIQDENGEALKAEKVTYGGWRGLPWLMLDMSQPAARAHLTCVVKTMREEWGIEFFKLDANYWGALKGQRFIANVTGVEAYRMGMEAIAQGAGNAWLLGCNAPMWPSLGLVDAMRISDDVERTAARFSQIARENFFRSWQHKKLWHIDPDCLTLMDIQGQETDEENYSYHRDVMAAVGGSLFSGDVLANLKNGASETVSRLIARHHITSSPVQFTDLSLNYGVLPLDDGQTLHAAITYFDNDWVPVTVKLEADKKTDWFDFWSGEKINSKPCKHIQIDLSKVQRSRLIINK